MLLSHKTKPTPATTRTPTRLNVETLEAREVLYAVSGNAWINPQLITIGFVPDGTVLGANNAGPITSNLQTTFDNHTNATFRTSWRNQILKAAQVWAQQTNLNFALVSDNGANLGSGAYQQGDPNMADIRIGGYNFGTTTLAQAYSPPAANGISSSGDIQFNTGLGWNINATYDLFTVAMHEFGHALGLYHGASGSVMFGSYGTVKTGLAPDDVNGIRAVTGWSANGFTSPGYGGARTQDSYDATSNGSFATASDVTAQINTGTKTALLQNLDITTTTDNDYYKFTVPAGLGGTLTVKVQSSGLSLLAPQVALFNNAQANLQSATAGTDFDGATLTLTYTVTAGQVYYLRVAGANTTANGTGRYALALGFASTAAPTASPPNTTTVTDPTATGGGQAIGLGPEVRVNTTTTGAQWTSSFATQSVAMAPDGTSVVVWMSNGQDGSDYGVYARRFDAAGTPLSGEFLVNVTTAGAQQEPAVAVDGSGNFVIVWSGLGNGTQAGIWARRYNAAGTALTGEFRVNGSAAGTVEYPTVSANAAGAFVVAWVNTSTSTSSDVYAQRYNASGVAQGSEFRVNVTTAGAQSEPSVGLDATGNFVVAWTHMNASTYDCNVMMRRYNAAGTALATEVRVNTYTTDQQSWPDIGVDANGNFLIAWLSHFQDGSMHGIYAQRYAANGSKLGGEFRVNTYTNSYQTHPCVAVFAGGNYFITWESLGQDGTDNSYGIYGQQISASGAKQGSEFRVNSTTSGQQYRSSMALNTSGDAVIVWCGNGAGDADGIFAQRYAVSYGGMSPMEAEGPHGFDPEGCGCEGHAHEEAGEGCGCATCSTAVAEVRPLTGAVWSNREGFGQLLHSLLASGGRSAVAATSDRAGGAAEDHGSVGSEAVGAGARGFNSDWAPGHRRAWNPGTRLSISTPAFGGWQWLSLFSWA